MAICDLFGEALRVAVLGSLIGAASLPALPLDSPALPQTDSDHDGLTDALEQRLLLQFEPHFMVGEKDCSASPAEFKVESMTPEVVADNRTIYGQVFPSREMKDRGMLVEIHYYHLWRKDCGGHGHPLDTEHIAVLVQPSDARLDLASWKAMYWYAAAHENTVCDVSQIAKASALEAEDRGATVWISEGKHASYLNERLCHGGCGADRCEKMARLEPAAFINLGEPEFPMNGSLFIASALWPLREKMMTSNFSAASIARLEENAASGIAWFKPGRHPAQGIIARSSSTEQALAGSGRNTTSAISQAGNSTSEALADASDSTDGALAKAGAATGNSLGKSYRDTMRALGISAHHVGRALRIAPK